MVYRAVQFERGFGTSVSILKETNILFCEKHIVCHDALTKKV
jgi:hypothetical protein